jgi:hypothetical protein
MTLPGGLRRGRRTQRLQIGPSAHCRCEGVEGKVLPLEILVSGIEQCQIPEGVYLTLVLDIDSGKLRDDDFISSCPPKPLQGVE